MNTISIVFLISALLPCFCLPPHRRTDSHLDDNRIDEKDNENGYSMEQLGIEYTRYLQEVVDTLEKDEAFKKKLENAKEHEIKSAKIAEELEYVNHHVRSKLDELKRTELTRLKDLAKQTYGGGGERSANPFGHLDHENPNTFEIEDLKKLIHKVAQDLEEADKKRKEAFKTYEMEKHFEREQTLKNMTEEERKKFIQHEEDIRKKEEVAAKRVHHPGSKQQLEEVWENQDHMSKNDFEPRTFFAMHDVDNNGFLDEDEIKTLFIKELDKMYASGTLQGDMVERAEEMERMREHVFGEVDKNKDRLISWDEFDAMSRQPDFNEDPGWQPLDHNQVYTPEEWQAYEHEKLAEMERLRRAGKLPSDQGYYAAQANGGYGDPNMHHGAGAYAPPYYPQQGVHPQQQGYPQQMAGYPQQGYPQPPPGGHGQQQVMPQQVQYQNQAAAPNAIPQQNGVPVQQYQQQQQQVQSNIPQPQAVPVQYQQPVVPPNNIPQQQAVPVQNYQQQQQPIVNSNNIPQQQQQPVAVPQAQYHNVNIQQQAGAAVPQFQSQGQVQQNKVASENKITDHQQHFESKTN